MIDDRHSREATLKSLLIRPFAGIQMDPQDTSARELELPSEIGVPEAEALRIELAARLERGEAMVISAARVQRIGIAGLQVLASLATMLRAARAPLTLLNPTAAFIDAARCLGLADLLGVA